MLLSQFKGIKISYRWCTFTVYRSAKNGSTGLDLQALNRKENTQMYKPYRVVYDW